jgi:hypothetical protein
MPYADQPARRGSDHTARGDNGRAYREAVALVRERALEGERCWFWRRPGHEECPGRIRFDVHYQTRWAFTAHHLQRLMDGGAAVVQGRAMAPAHRACNARDGLRAQNARRARGGASGMREGADGSGHSGMGGRMSPTVKHESGGQDRTSRRW